jgi:hypothetical protein
VSRIEGGLTLDFGEYLCKQQQIVATITEKVKYEMMQILISVQWVMQYSIAVEENLSL